MDDLDSFSIESLKKEVVRLKRENHAYMTTINKLLKDLNLKSEEITHLQSLVSQTVPVLKKEENKVILHITPEEDIAMQQLERLRQLSKTRTLTLEEIRAYDLLVKNKRLSLDESTINISKNKYRDVSEAELFQIAAQASKPSDNSDVE